MAEAAGVRALLFFEVDLILASFAVTLLIADSSFF
jgi:hypothetical protein